MSERLPDDVSLRDLVDNDWDAVADLYNFYETSGVTGEILRQRQSNWNDGDPRLLKIASDDAGKIIGYCRSARRSSEPEGVFRISVFIDPAFSGRGLGRHLTGIAEEFVTANGGVSPMVSVEETCIRGREFAEKFGYSPVQHLFESRLDLPIFDPIPYNAPHEALGAQGIVFTSMEELGDSEESWRKLYELDSKTDGDTPGSEFWNIGGYEEYVARTKGSHGFSLAGIHLALQGDQWVGVNIVVDSPKEGEMATAYTGVLREFRGKGVAQVLKVIGIQRAQSLGAGVMVTNNDERNAPMLAINKKLGFVELPGFYVYRKDLTN